MFWDYTYIWDYVYYIYNEENNNFICNWSMSLASRVFLVRIRFVSIYKINTYKSCTPKQFLLGKDITEKYLFLDSNV